MQIRNPASHAPAIGEPAFCNTPDDSLTETQDLTWRLLDGIISDGEHERLQTLLSESLDARLEYIDAVQLHAGLLSLAEKL